MIVFHAQIINVKNAKIQIKIPAILAKEIIALHYQDAFVQLMDFMISFRMEIPLLTNVSHVQVLDAINVQE